MVEISLSGSGEGPGWATAPGYSTAAFSATSDKGPTVNRGRTPLRMGAIPPDRGEKTYSAAVMRALEDFVRRAKARQILELRGSGLWEGELEAMRRDAPSS